MVEEDILVVTHPLAPASENHVESLLAILSSITEVRLVTANLSGESKLRDSYDVREISPFGMGDSVVSAALRFVVNQIRMARVILRGDEEIIWFFGATSYLLPIVTARLIGRLVVLQPRGDVPLTLRLHWREKMPGFLAEILAGSVDLFERVGFRLADGIITYTPSMAHELGLYRFDDKLFTQGARYVDTERFSPREPVDDRDVIVGYVGRLDEEKGIRQFSAAAHQFPTNVTTRIVGNGPLKEWIEIELEDEIHSGQVQLIGWVDHENVHRELAKLRLLILPSAPTEGLPTIALEAMSCGTPVLTTPVAGLDDLIENEKTGFFLESMNADDIADAVEQILARCDLEEVSKTARRVVEREYTFDAAVENYEEFVDTLVSSSNR